MLSGFPVTKVLSGSVSDAYTQAINQTPIPETLPPGVPWLVADPYVAAPDPATEPEWGVGGAGGDWGPDPVFTPTVPGA